MINQNTVQLEKLMSLILFNDQRYEHSILHVVLGGINQIGHTDWGSLVDEAEDRLHLREIAPFEIFSWLPEEVFFGDYMALKV